MSETLDKLISELQDAQANLAQVQTEWDEARPPIETKLQGLREQRAALEETLRQSRTEAGVQIALATWKALLQECFTDPQQWPSLQPQIAEAWNTFDAASRRRQEEEEMYQNDSVHAEIQQCENALQEGRRRIEAAENRTRGLPHRIREQRIADYRYALGRIAAVAGRIHALRETQFQTPLIDELQSNWHRLQRDYEQLEFWRPDPKLLREPQVREFETKARCLYKEMKQAEAAYCRSVNEEILKRHNLASELESQLPALYAARDAAQANLPEPIGV